MTPEYKNMTKMFSSWQWPLEAAIYDTTQKRYIQMDHLGIDENIPGSNFNLC